MAASGSPPKGADYENARFQGLFPCEIRLEKLKYNKKFIIL
jgi:hypothetical protein